MGRLDTTNKILHTQSIIWRVRFETIYHHFCVLSDITNIKVMYFGAPRYIQSRSVYLKMTMNWRRNIQNCSLLTAQLYLAVETVSWSKIYLFKDRGCFLTFQRMVCFSMARWKFFTRLSTVDKRFYFQQLVCWSSPPPAPPAILAGNGHVLNGRSYLVSARRKFLARILKLHCACAVMKPPASPRIHLYVYI